MSEKTTAQNFPRVFESEDEFIDLLRDIVGPSLRGVFRYCSDDIDILHTRPDVRSQYSPETLSQRHEQFVFENIAKDSLEACYALGAARCTINLFEDAMLVHFMTAPNAGFVVGIDADSDLSLLSFVRACEAWDGAA